MHPAFSVLIFTVTAGAGYGLLGWLSANELLTMYAMTAAQKVTVGVIAMVLISVGLLSSTWHLTNPKNAWRAFSRFRTSWLSREMVFALLLYPIAGLYAASLLWDIGGTSLWAALSLVLSLVIVFVTSMIYASLKTIRQWHTPLVPALFLLFAALSGGLAYAMLLAWQGHNTADIQDQLMILGLVTAALKVGYFYWFRLPSASTIQTATGFSQHKVGLLDAGHSAPSFLNKEFMFEVENAKLIRTRWLMFMAAFIAPALLLTGQGVIALIAAWVIMMAGLLVERWLFFAEARHVVRLLHGHQQV